MKLNLKVLLFIASLTMICPAAFPQQAARISGYRIAYQKKPMKIDGNWKKADWRKVASARIRNIMGNKPEYMPSAEVKMKYDSLNLYVIFRVKERSVRSVTTDINGPVWDDSCVEFFFAPDSASPSKYFNLEVNCGGVALMRYNTVPRKEYKVVDPDDLRKIEIAHSLPEVNDPEIAGPVTWTLEYKLPLALLKKYAKVSQPHSGVVWKANFYKTSTKTSNPHYLTWSFIDRTKPDFHLPEYFGGLTFE